MKEQLIELLSIKKQCIWVKGLSEKELIAHIVNGLSDYGIDRIFTWSNISNIEEIIVKNNKIKNIEINSGINKQLNVFFKIMQKEDHEAFNKNEEYALILKDYDLILDNANYIRFIKEVSETCNDKYIPIIITSEKYDPPPKIKHLFDVINFKNPTEEEIFDLLTCYEKSRNLTLDDITKISKSLIGFSKIEIIELLDLSFYRYNKLDFNLIKDKKIELIKNTEVLDYKVPTLSLKEIGGNENFKRWFEEIKLCMSDEALSYGVERPKGYLALGIPGSSKSALAEAIANDLSIPFLKLNMSKILSKFVGESERKIEQAISLINACAPCLLLIDEVEKNLGGYQSSNASDSGTLARVFGKILEMLVDNDKGIFTVMTSNNVKDLPPELTRAGRLDAIWFFGLPNEEERKEIFNIHLKKRNQNISEEIIEYIAKETSNYTGAEIEQIVKSSIKKAYVNKIKYSDNFRITKDILLEAKQDVIPIFKSSKEKIYALENYAKGRALYANQTKKDEIDLDSLDLDELIN